MEIKSSEVERLVEKNRTLTFDVSEQEELTSSRDRFRELFTLDVIKNLTPERYFQGKGVKEGNFTYELEWGIAGRLGSIRGGSNFKFGYEADFSRIREFIAFVISQREAWDTFYNDKGSISGIARQMVDRSKTIKGLKSGRTTIGKILSIYYPSVFLYVFTDQDHYLRNLYADYEIETKGLESFFTNNQLLYDVKEKVRSILSDEQAGVLTGERFASLLYATYPKNVDVVLSPESSLTASDAEQPFDALEVQHYQTLVHRNFRRLFPTFHYFDEESQRDQTGHYDTQEIGILDFLAIDDATENLVVIELKRRASDQTLGQLLRYMGWVKENLCENDRQVHGIILADTIDVRLRYAVNVVPHVEIRKIKLSIDVQAFGEH